MPQHSPDKMFGAHLNSRQSSLPTSSDTDSIEKSVNPMICPTTLKIMITSPFKRLKTVIKSHLSEKHQKLAAFIALSIALSLAALDTVLIATALPTIAVQFKLDSTGYAWVGSSYLLAFAANVPAWGGVSDIYGRRRPLLLANGVFIVGSLLSALSKSLPLLIAGRIVQGFGAGGIMTLVYICVQGLYSARESGWYFGILGAVYAVASAIGPVLGGVFTEKTTWQVCFWINLPFGVLAIVLLGLFLDIPDPATPVIKGLKEIDFLGSITVACATIMLLLGLQFGGVTFPWQSVTVILLLIFGSLTFVLFAFTQWKVSSKPVMPLRIFDNRSNICTLIVVAFDAMVFNSVAYFLPLYFQTTLHADPITAGTWMLALALPLAAVSLGSGYHMNKKGKYIWWLRSGLAIMTIGVGLCIILPEYVDLTRKVSVPMVLIVVFLIIIGAGFGPNFQGPMIALRVNLRKKDIDAGLATLAFLRMLCGAIGVILGQTLLQKGMRKQLPLLDHDGVPFDVLAALARGPTISQSLLDNLPNDLLDNIRQVQAKSFLPVWGFFAAVSGLAFFASWGIKQKKMSEEHETNLPKTTSAGGSSAASVAAEDATAEPTGRQETV